MRSAGVAEATTLTTFENIEENQRAQEELVHAWGRAALARSRVYGSSRIRKAQ